MKFSLLQNAEVFLSDLRLSIQHAKQYVWIEMMIFEISPRMDIYIDLLSEAVKRGVAVRVSVDWITLRYYGENLDVYPSFSSKKFRKRKLVTDLGNKMIDELIRAGVHVEVHNVPSWLGKIVLLGKRNHNKIALVDDIAWIGGTNLIKDPENFVDFMIKISDQQIVNALKDYLISKPAYDTRVQLNNTYTFLIDSGRKGSSLIYDQALLTIQQATHTIILVSQMLPDSGLLSLLVKKSQKGVTVIVIISNRGHNIFTKFPFRYHYELLQKKIQYNKYFKLYHSQQRIHAKLLLIDGKKAFFGSHNFEKWNELIGIEETDFLTMDKNLIQQFEQFWKSLVG